MGVLHDVLELGAVQRTEERRQVGVSASRSGGEVGEGADWDPDELPPLSLVALGRAMFGTHPSFKWGLAFSETFRQHVFDRVWVQEVRIPVSHQQP